MKAKKWILARRIQGEPGPDDVKLQEEQLPDLKPGDVLLEGVCWSVDPYMRLVMKALSPGSTIAGEQLAKVTQSKNSKYPVGTLLLAKVGWVSHSVTNPDTAPGSEYAGLTTPSITPAPNMGKLPKSTSVGVLGMPGCTAYFGLLEICDPKPGETVLVTGAAGAVGSIVGQIAKIKGCKVIGFAGTDQKCKYLKEELGFDHAFNYKTTNGTEALKKVAPNGVDCFFDNVGGDFSTNVIANNMNLFGRMAICGVISRYNEDSTELPMGRELFSVILHKRLKVQGFIVNKWFDQFSKAADDMRTWIEQGKLKYREHITSGFENMYSAFRGLLKGENIGKAVVTA